MGKKITLVQLNDTHSYLEAHNEIFYEDKQPVFRKAGGYARIQTLLNDMRKEGPVVALDNGDTIHGTYEAVATKGWNMVPILNEMGISAMTFHWDTGYGPENLKKIGQALNYPILAINAYDEKNDDLVFEPYHILEIDGVSIGVIGIACNIIDKTMPAHFSEGMYFTLGNEELPVYIDELKSKNVDIILVLSHLGFPQDIKLMSEVEGVDICLSGHTHNRIESTVQIGETTLIQSGSQGSFMGKLEISLDDKKIKAVEHELIPVTEDIPEDEALREKIDEALRPFREQLDKKAGTTEINLHRGFNLESPMDNFLLEAILHHTGSDIAFSNGWRYGAPIVKGDITLRELFQIIPMNPPISTAELTGSEILEMLEENMENTYSSDPYHQMGGYLKRAVGLQAYIKVENPKGQRIQKLFIGGKEVDRTKVYSVSYVTHQGVPKNYGKNHKNLEKRAVQAMQDYLSERGSYDQSLKQTFCLI
ncbi:MAG: bifunctional metallophosphatase/5'-nucleotidase [Desemzia incerta]|uniref:bifunctional metallophosphatase/5'-nucleotidase n=1 Tax=Desemzia incerta TaxID=82801 RepID=UPI003316358C